MNIWTKRLLILVSVGGGYCGAVFMFLLFPQVRGNVAGYFLIAAMIATFAFGVFAGLRFIEGEAKGLKLLRWFFAIQVPILSSPIFAYQLSSGFGVNLSWIGERLSAFFRFGSEMGVWILQDRPWGLGVNAFALIMLVWTHRLIRGREKRPNKAPEPTTTSVTSPAAQEPRQP
jgi:hypothetical protein